MNALGCLACERVKRGDVNLEDLESHGNGDRSCNTCGFLYHAECFVLEDAARDFQTVSRAARLQALRDFDHARGLPRVGYLLRRLDGVRIARAARAALGDK